MTTIPLNTEEIRETLTKLREEIKIAKADIKKKQSSIEAADSFLGLFFGGASSMLNMERALSTEEGKEELERKGCAVPENVEKAFDALIEATSDHFFDIAFNINDFEDQIFEIIKAPEKDKPIIRNNLKERVRILIINLFESDDIECLDKMTGMLFKYYDSTFEL